MNNLKVTITAMRFSAPELDVSWGWLRRILNLPTLAEAVNVIENISLDIVPGKIVSVVGASGSGKTTLLRIIAGLETNYEGSVTLCRESIIKPDARIYLMPQAHTLLPWRTVEGNLLFNGGDPETIERILNTFDMLDMKHRYPRTLSGGERAQVALMCAICAKPQVLLLDEPFRGIDWHTKERCMNDLSKWLDETEYNVIVIFVSHDISDAVFFSDKVVVVSQNPLRLKKSFDCPSNRIMRSTELIDLEKQVRGSFETRLPTSDLG
tara:strand:- start:662 stop:1459 length:798 start_codon:yes stop_codon:yes gene_type:complete